MGQSQPSTVTQKNTYEMSPEQKQLFDLAMPMVENYASKPIERYQGSTMAGFTPEQIQSQQMYLDQGGGNMQTLANQGQAAQSMMLDPNFMLNPAQNPYIQAQANAVTGNVTDNLTRNILPQIRSGAQQAGGMYTGNNSRQGIAEGLAIGETGGQIGRALADMYGSLYTAGLGQMQNAIGMNPTAMTSGLIPADVIGSVGAQNQAMNQALLNESAGNFYTDQMLPYLQATDILGLLQGLPGGTGTSTVTGLGQKTNPLMGGLGMMSMLGPMLGLGGPAGGGLGLLAGLLGGM